MQKRLTRIREYLEKHQVDAILCEEPTMLYWLTGLIVSAGVCLITRTEERLIVDSRYFERADKESPIPVMLQKADLLQDLLSEFSPARIGFDSHHTTFAQYEAWNKAAGESDLVAIPHLFHQIREIKDAAELQALTEAAKLGSRGFDYGATLLREGITEMEVAREIELFWRREGGEKAAFEPIIAFGANSSMPHYRAGETRLKHGMNVLMDIGVTLNHYQSDMTRVLFFGTPNPKILEIYEIVLQAQLAALDLCKPGSTTEGIDAAARGVIEGAGYGDLFTHSLGHGVGLDIHEHPFLRPKKSDKETLVSEGMVFTIEPGIYLPDEGGIRIEDTVVITKSGHLNLTDRSKELMVIHLG